MLCLIIAPLPPGKNPFAVKIMEEEEEEEEEEKYFI
jgi:hypothetical protein